MKSHYDCIVYVFLVIVFRSGITFYSDNMPTTFDLFAPCFEDDYEDVKDELYVRIDALIVSTDLSVAPNKYV